MNPKKLNAFTVAHKQKLKEQDALMHLWFGTYGISAFSFAIEHCLNGRKAKSEYIKELALDVAEKNRPLTEEEKQREVDLFFEREKVRRMNWRRNNKSKQGER